jgi:hypothetical protein
MNADSTRVKQMEICERIGSAFSPCDLNLKAGIAMSTLQQAPLQGVRVSADETTCGWYIWGGKFSDSPDFFQSVHVAHLSDLLPSVIPYLGLSPGFKFIIDDSGYEDIWYED